MIRHVALFKWQADTPDEAVAALTAALVKMPQVMPFIRRYEMGPDLGLGAGRHDFALVADFDDEDDYETYANHPHHLEVTATYVRPIVEGVTRVQYRVG